MSSMEIWVRAWVKNVTGKESTLLSEAYFTFVALDNDTTPAKLPALKPETEEEMEQYEEALKRKQEKTKTMKNLSNKINEIC